MSVLVCRVAKKTKRSLDFFSFPIYCTSICGRMSPDVPRSQTVRLLQSILKNVILNTNTKFEVLSFYVE